METKTLAIYPAFKGWSFVRLDKDRVRVTDFRNCENEGCKKKCISTQFVIWEPNDVSLYASKLELMNPDDRHITQFGSKPMTGHNIPFLCPKCVQAYLEFKPRAVE